MRTRRTIRVCLLFGGLTVSLASLPAMLERIDSVKSASGTGMPSLEGLGLGGVSSSDPATQSLLDRARGSEMLLISPESEEGIDLSATLADAEAARERAMSRRAPSPGVTRVLGPDD